MNINMTLYDFLRAGHVKRWHIVNVVRDQTMADHGYMVALIALNLFDQQVGVRDDLEGTLRLLLAALFHDSTEIRTGDLPTPGKNLIREFVGDPEFFDKLEFEIMPEIPYLKGHISAALEMFVKMADAIEAAHFIRENGAGRHAEIVAGGCWRRVEDLTAKYTELTGVDWYEAVNKVLSALGMPQLYKEARISPP